jgi:hypothetical protein
MKCICDIRKNILFYWIFCKSDITYISKMSNKKINIELINLLTE